MDTETRIARLEERLTWLQRHCVEQDRIISTQTFEIEALKNALAAIKNNIASSTPTGEPAPEQRPPHY